MSMSRQREYQMRMRAAGKCVQCGCPANGAARCPNCAIKHRKQRQIKGKHQPWKPGGRGRPPQFIVANNGKIEVNL
jgi:hypothetical protein